MIKILKGLLWSFLSLLLLYIVGIKLYNYFYSRPLQIERPPHVLNSKFENKLHLKHLSKKTVRILVVSGGGVAGIIPLVYLNYMEEQSGKPINELFDLFSGTSTGAIIVSVLNIPDAHGHPLFSAKKILNYYQKFSQEVMRKNRVRQFFTLGGRVGPRFDIHDLHQQMLSILGKNLKVRDLLKDVMLTVFDIDIAKTQIVKNWDPESPLYHYALSDVLTAAGAAPMFFSGVQFNHFIKDDSETFMDNAIIANNPFPYVLFQAINLYPKAKKFVVVYLDTSNLTIKNLNVSQYAYNQWGSLQWAPFLMRILYESQKKQIHEGIKNLLLLLPKERFSYHYYGINQQVPAFDASEENIAKTRNIARSELEKNKSSLKKILIELNASN